MLHLRPELVDMSKAEDDAFHASLRQPVACALPFDAMTTRGVIGYPTAATAEKGRELLEGIATALRAGIVHWSASSPFGPTSLKQ